MPPLVSLYIPTCGRPELLLRALKSALVQTYPELEFLVVIDGPDPATSAALADYRGNPRLKILALATRGGACRARNAAIFAASGELITGLDDDDELLPDHIEKLVGALGSSGAAFVATTNVLLRLEGPLIRHRFEGPVLLDPLLEENIVGNQVLTRTSYLRELGGFDPAMPAWQDYDLWVRLAARYGPGFKVDARSYLQHQEHGFERISAKDRILAAQRVFVQKHAQLLSPKEVASLELLALATAHEKMSVPQLIRFARLGLNRRAGTAFIADRLPSLRSAFLAFSRTIGRSRR